MGFTWDEDMNAMDIPMLNQKEESSESEEEEDLQSKVLCTSVVCTGDTTWWWCFSICMSVCPIAKPFNPREHL